MKSTPKKNDGGPIAPNIEVTVTSPASQTMNAAGGLSIRDWFAELRDKADAEEAAIAKAKGGAA